MDHITVIGAGLAGSEAAWQIAARGIKVKLYEMRPVKMTPAHSGSFFAELVCSNSFRANNLENAAGLLKEELRLLGSLIVACADQHRVPAGGALAVDREGFSQEVTARISQHANIEIIREEIRQIPASGITVIATGPLTSESLSQELTGLTDEEFLYFHDAAAPIVEGDSIDYSKVFWASRYDKGDADYLNCPLSREEYGRFYQALCGAEVHARHSFEEEKYFEGCMPVEVMAGRGPQTLLFGPLKPVGLRDPKSTVRPFAVVQLRKDNAAGTLFNIVGFQTNLKRNEQKRVFRMIPGLEQAEFARFGMMHRNTFINAPKLLLETTQLKKHPHILVAGQLSGVEGYVESTASGLLAGINASRIFQGAGLCAAPRESALGSLLHYITHTDADHFQPMNITFGLLPSLAEKIKDKREKNRTIAGCALEAMQKSCLIQGMGGR